MFDFKAKELAECIASAGESGNEQIIYNLHVRRINNKFPEFLQRLLHLMTVYRRGYKFIHRLRVCLVVHPLLFAYFPIIYLYSHNVAELDFRNTLKATVTSLGFSLAIWLIVYLYFRNVRKSALVTSVLILVFFSFSTLYNLVRGFEWGGVVLGNQKNLAVIFLLSIALFIYIINKTSVTTQLKLTHAFNITGTLMLLTPALSISLHILSYSMSKKGDLLINNGHTRASTYKAPQTAPDIYYIILDGYGRGDVLNKLHGFDNDTFIRELEQRNFYVAKESIANYSQTFLSLTSSLNFNYIDHAALQKPDAMVGLKALLYKNKVVSFLKEQGYKVVSTASGHESTTLKTDLQLSPSLTLNEFESTFLTYTPFPSVLNGFLFKKLFGQTFSLVDLHELHRERVRFAFRETGRIKSTPDQPLFVISHILLAHPPFVFDEDGNPITPSGLYSMDQPIYDDDPEEQRKAYMARYAGQVSYGNQLLLNTLDEILKDSTREKVIIVQGDHGPMTNPAAKHASVPDIQERMTILNAYYFPQSKKDSTYLYSGISPVNTFRVVFNVLFKQGYQLVEDKSHYVPYNQNFKVHDVTHLVRPLNDN